MHRRHAVEHGSLADDIQTDVWVSTGEPKEVWEERIALSPPFEVNMKPIEASANPKVKLVHCLPAFHDTESTLGKQIAETCGMSDGLEVTRHVIESERNVAIEQPRNRLHTLEALLVATLGH